MDFIVNINGQDILIAEEEETTKSRERLRSFYAELLRARGIELNQEQERSLQTWVMNLTESHAETELAGFDRSMEKRLKTYANRFRELTKEEQETADALMEVIDAVSEDPEQESYVINGNKFVFEKGSLDIKKYADKLNEIGKRNHGNTWFIYLDDDGELVIY